MSAEIQPPGDCFWRVCAVAVEPLRDVRRVVGIAVGIVAVVALAAGFYAALWWMTGLLWSRIAVLLGSA